MILFSKQLWAWSFLYPLLLLPKYSYPSPIPETNIKNQFPPNTTSIAYPSPSGTGAKLQSSDLPSTVRVADSYTTANIPPGMDTGPQVRAVDVPHNFFYTTDRLQMRCREANMFESGDMKMVQVPGIDPSEIIDFVDGRLNANQVRTEIDSIRRNQLRCKRHCTCSEEGYIEEGPRDLARPNVRNCNSELNFPLKCISLWGCYCTAVLRQPRPTIPGATLEDYMRVLSSVPSGVQVDNPDYVWRNAPESAFPGFDDLMDAPGEVDSLTGSPTNMGIPSVHYGTEEGAPGGKPGSSAGPSSGSRELEPPLPLSGPSNPYPPALNLLAPPNLNQGFGASRARSITPENLRINPFIGEAVEDEDPALLSSRNPAETPFSPDYWEYLLGQPGPSDRDDDGGDQAGFYPGGDYNPGSYWFKRDAVPNPESAAGATDSTAIGHEQGTHEGMPTS
ncbi:hypothetical protein TWF788_005147 [Orbilia oligospora]|uniref:Uncharacterized protein n=1 Tax=Orbilia oligospora TaxID=2813651 RepID=A0A7C8JX45_ORBOL|nr:hypothetical protein TWF788_005147 [Orbilia oligospora]